MAHTRCSLVLAFTLGLWSPGCTTGEEPCECEDPTPCDDDDDTLPGDDDDTNPGDDDDGPMSIEDFTDHYEHLYCKRAMECYDAITLEALGWSSVQDCLDFFDAATDDDDDYECEYRPQFADACLHEVADVSCADFITGTWMDACLEVWDCP